MLIPDYETEVDFLNCEAISGTVVELLNDNRNRALTVGIHGDWGAGKSSILKMIECDLAKEPRVAVLWFNGWTFEGFEDAKTVLIESTITEVCRLQTGGAKVKKIGKKLLKRVNWLKLAKRGSGVAFNILTGLPSADQLETAVGALRNLSQSAQNINPEEIPGKIDQISGYLNPADENESIPETIHAFREEFRALLDEAKIDQLVILIDDLDRCLPETAIETLEAIRLFLFVPKTAFVIGADEAMIEYAVRQHFPDLPVASGPIPYARNYLEKLVQIPFRIPALGAQETRIYVMLLLIQSLLGEEHEGFKTLLKSAKDEMKKPWLGVGLSQSDVRRVDPGKQEALDSAFILAQQIAPILADGTKGNPRQIKRFLNSLLVRQVIAKARGFGDAINQRILAKLMLADRFQPDFYEHISAQAMSSSEGMSSDLNMLEGVKSSSGSEDDGEEVSENNKKSVSATNTNKDIEKWLERDWLQRWFDIEPKLGEMDLRPYVFVARDKRLLLSATGMNGLETLVERLSRSKLEVRAAEPEVRLLSAGDAKIVFNGLREKILSAGSYSNPPQGIEGISVVAKHHPSLQTEVISLLAGIEARELGLWVVKGWNETITEEKASQELDQLVNKWANQDDNKILKQAANAALETIRKGGR
jgi:predicted KAP-like P-loop ATPase